MSDPDKILGLADSNKERLKRDKAKRLEAVDFTKDQDGLDKQNAVDRIKCEDEPEIQGTKQDSTPITKEEFASDYPIKEAENQIKPKPKKEPHPELPFEEKK